MQNSGKRNSLCFKWNIKVENIHPNYPYRRYIFAVINTVWYEYNRYIKYQMKYRCQC